MNAINLVALVHFIKIGVCVVAIFGYVMYRWSRN
jgi:hypothetical protein